MSVVLDSSIVGCWCFPDEASPVADAAMSAVAADEAVVPAVWWFEVRNLLLTGERVGRMNPIGTAGFLGDLESLSIRIDRTPASHVVLALARAHRLTIYDAAYLELALRADVPLATLDQQLARAARAAKVPCSAHEFASDDRTGESGHAPERGADPDHPRRQPAAPAGAGPAVRAPGAGRGGRSGRA